MSRRGEEDPDEMEVNRQLLFDTYKNAQTEEEYAEMVLSELGDPDMGSELGSGGNYHEEQYDQIPMNHAAPLANYMQPTMASVLPPYLQGEIERVRNSYRTGSYNSIKRLPTSLLPGQIRENRKQHITENLLLNSTNVFKPSSIKNEPFQRPEYIGTDYDKMKNLHKYWLDEEKVQTDSLSRKPFVVNSRVRSKTEDIFFDPEYRFPGMGPGTGLKRLESMVRDNNNSDKILLEPGYVLQHKLGVGSGLQVKKWTQKIHAKLVKDWPQYQFRVKFTKSNELIVQFAKPAHVPLKPPAAAAAVPFMATGGGGGVPKTGEIPPVPPSAAPGQLNVIFPPPNNALNKYMHNMAAHGLASSFGLKKRGDRWNIYEVEYLNSSGSLDGTIPSYGTDPNSPLHAALRKASSSQDAALSPGGTNHRTPRASDRAGAGAGAGASMKRSAAAGICGDSGSSGAGGGHGHGGGGSAGSSSSAGSAGGGGDAPHAHKSVRWFTRSSGSLNAETLTPAAAPAASTLLVAPGAGAGTGAGISPSQPLTASTTPRGVTFAEGQAATGKEASGTPSSNAGTPPGVQSFPSGEGSPSLSPPLDVEAPTQTAEQRPFSSPPRRPPRIDTHVGDRNENVDVFQVDEQPMGQSSAGPTSAQKVYYLTYSFYAPWIHTGHMNVRRAASYASRVKAQKFGDKYHQKYSLTGGGAEGGAGGRGRLNTDDTANTAGTGGDNGSDGGRGGGGGGMGHAYNIYDSFRSDAAMTNAGSSVASTPHVTAGRFFMAGMLRDQKYNNSSSNNGNT